MTLLAKKNVLIMGAANENSLAWEMAKVFHQEGANIALSYINESVKKRLSNLAKEVEAHFIFEMNVTKDEHYNQLYKEISSHWDHVDVIIHSLAFAKKEDLHGDFINTSREGFKYACDISAFSLIGISNKLLPLLKSESSILAMTYYGSQKIIQNYNLMGVAKAALESSMRYLAHELGSKNIRVNCLSAGPVRTLAATGIKGFKGFLKEMDERSPLKRKPTSNDVAKTALYLSSDLASGVTGQVIYVDCGLSILGY